MSASQNQPLRVAVNAQLLPGRGSGGVESVVVGLVRALGQLDDGPEEYTIIGPWQDPNWLEPYIGPNQRIVRGPRPVEYLLGRSMGPLRSPARKLRDFLVRSLGISGLQHQVAISDGFYESLGCDVIHFPYQQFVICARPTIYNPHDLQHLHYPQFFSPSTIAGRETIYPAGCHFAHTVPLPPNGLNRILWSIIMSKPINYRSFRGLHLLRHILNRSLERIADVQQEVSA